MLLITGIATFISLVFTASISVLNKKGIHIFPFSWHPIMARITIILAIIHGIAGIYPFILSG